MAPPIAHTGSGSGSSTKPVAGPGAATTAAPHPASSLLAAIPADTAFLYVTLDPIAGEVWTRLRAELDGPALRSAAQASITLDPVSRLRDAAIAELGSALASSTGVRAIGLDARSRFALYGVGAVPVFRIELGDPGAAQRALERIIATAGSAAVRHGTAPAWLVDGEHGTLLASIAGDQLVVAIGERAQLTSQVATLLGAAPSPISEATLRQLAKDRGLATSGIGWIDPPRIAALAKTPGAIPALDKLGDGCKAIVIAAIADLPRVSLGATETSANKLAFTASFELAAAPAAVLQQASRSTPSLPAQLAGSPLVAASLLVPPSPLGSPWIAHAERLAAACDANGKQKPTRPSAPWNTIQAGALAIYDGKWTGFLPDELDGFVGVVAPDPGSIVAAIVAVAPSLGRSPPRDGGPFVPLQLQGLPEVGLARRGKLVLATMGPTSKARVADLAVRDAAPLFRLFVDVARIRARLPPDAKPRIDTDDNELYRADPASGAEATIASAVGRMLGTLEVVVEVADAELRLRITSELAPPPPVGKPAKPAQPSDPRIAIRDHCLAILRRSFASTAPALAKLGIKTDLDGIAKTYTTSIQADSMMRSCAKLTDAARACLLAAPNPIAAAPTCARSTTSAFDRSALELPPVFSFFGPRPLEARLHPPIDGAAVRAKLVGTWVQKGHFETRTWVVDAAGKLVETTVDNDTKTAETKTYRIGAKRAGKLELHEGNGHSTHSFFMPAPDRFHDQGDATPIAAEDRFIAPLGDGYLIREPSGCWVVTREGLLVDAQCKVAVQRGARTLAVTYTPPCVPRPGGSCARDETYRFFPGFLVEAAMLEREPFVKR